MVSMDAGGHLFEGLARRSRDFVCAFEADGTLVWANDRSTEFIGRTPEEVLGTNIADYIHPDDLERAFLGIAVAVSHSPRFSPAVFRIRHADGSWVRLEANGTALAPECPELIGVTLRLSQDTELYQQTLERLIEGESMASVLASVPEFTIWRNHDTLAAITWSEPTGARASAGSQLPPELLGLSQTDIGPWAEAMRTGRDQFHPSLTELPSAIRASAGPRWPARRLGPADPRPGRPSTGAPDPVVGGRERPTPALRVLRARSRSSSSPSSSAGEASSDSSSTPHATTASRA